jgi:hypothetical protein
MHRSRPHADGVHHRLEAQPQQEPSGVGADLDASADFGDARRLLVAWTSNPAFRSVAESPPIPPPMTATFIGTLPSTASLRTAHEERKRCGGAAGATIGVEASGAGRLPMTMTMSCDDLVGDGVEILSYVLGLRSGIQDIVVDTLD